MYGLMIFTCLYTFFMFMNVIILHELLQWI